MVIKSQFHSMKKKNNHVTSILCYLDYFSNYLFLNYIFKTYTINKLQI